MHSPDQNLDDAVAHAKEGEEMVLENVLGLDKSDLDSLNDRQKAKLAQEILDSITPPRMGTMARDIYDSVTFNVDNLVVLFD